MDERLKTTRSKFLSLVLRHRPELIGLELGAGGWVETAWLLKALSGSGNPLTPAELQELVTTSPKQRFAFSDDGMRIRANQGHSVEVDLGLPALTPPGLLYHGTVASALDSILRDGLHKQQRHHVHLSADVETAHIVGGRRGKPVILEVAAGAMSRSGHPFFRSANGVWLTEAVPPQFLKLKD